MIGRISIDAGSAKTFGMKLSAKACSFENIRLWRDLYREEMRGQIVHDSLHTREGWAKPYILQANDSTAGYGSILVGGPWWGTRTVFEFYVLPSYRGQIFALFSVLVASGRATAIQAQTSDPLLLNLLYWASRDVRSEKIVFRDGGSTALPSGGASLRTIRPEDLETIFPHHREPVGDYVLEVNGEIVATGGVAWHYNRPYGDIFMEVDPRFRRKGYGGYLVQELKRICYQNGGIPCARCDPEDEASLRTIQKAGLIPNAHILTGSIAQPHSDENR